MNACRSAHGSREPVQHSTAGFQSVVSVTHRNNPPVAMLLSLPLPNLKCRDQKRLEEVPQEGATRTCSWQKQYKQRSGQTPSTLKSIVKYEGAVWVAGVGGCCKHHRGLRCAGSHIPLLEYVSRVGELVPLVKFLLHKHKDLALIPQNLCELAIHSGALGDGDKLTPWVCCQRS